MDDPKQAMSNVVRDLHNRNLAIPAGIILVLIVLAIVALPKSPAPLSAPASPQAAAPADNRPQRAAVASIVLMPSASLEGRRLRTFGSVDPFSPKGNAFKCQVETLFGVPVTTCVIGGIKFIGACEGPSCDTGSTGGGGPVDTPPPVTDDPDDGGDDVSEEPSFVVDVTLDGKTYKNLEAGDGVPSSGIPVLFYAGASTSGKSAMFLVADGTSVQGADFDIELGVFTVQEGDSVVLTDEAGKVYQFKLKDISKQS